MILLLIYIDGKEISPQSLVVMIEKQNTVMDEIRLAGITGKEKSSQVSQLDLLPSDLRDSAKSLPPEKVYTILELKQEGSGQNDSLIFVAYLCYKMGVSYDDTLEHLSSIYPFDRIDYETAPKIAVERIWAADGEICKLVDDEISKTPELKDEMLLRFLRTPSSALVEGSPGDIKTKTSDILMSLFKNEDIINIKHTQLEAGTLVKLKDLGALMDENGCHIENYNFLSPAVFKKIEGVVNTSDQRGRVSTSCNDNVKERNWVLLEYLPEKSKDDNTKLIEAERFNTLALAMSKFAPLVMVVETGGKSTQFWFDAEGVDINTRKSFFNLACLHGADPRLAVKSQIARMPNTPASGDGRVPQKMLYYDPERSLAPKEWDLIGFEDYIQKNKQLDYYYNGDSKTYLTRDNMGSWINLDRTSIRSHLMQKGYRPTTVEGENISPVDIVINNIQLDKNVEAILNSASGRHSGLYEEDGNRVIVKNSPHFIKARKGKWETIDKFLDGLLGHEEKQKDVFFGWLSDSIKKLRNGGKRIACWCQCQMLHIAGPPNSGKTLLFKDILMPCFASRSACADPLFRKFSSEFSAEMFGVELLYLDDSPVLEQSYSFRQEFGYRVKSHVVGSGVNYRQIRQDHINMRPWWRFVRLMNMEPETLSTIPPLEDGIEDKIILLHGESMENGPLCSEMLLPGWYDRIKGRISSEIPAFIHFLTEEFILPDDIRDPKKRYPTISFKSSELISEISQGSPETYIIHQFDNESKMKIFASDFHSELCDLNITDLKEHVLRPWTGTVDSLYDILCQSGHRQNQQRFVKSCPSPRVLLSQLRKLEKSNPDRVGYSKRLTDYPDRLNGVEYWVVFPPQEFKVDPSEPKFQLEDLF